MRVRHSHRGPLKGKAWECATPTANPSRGRLEGCIIQHREPLKGKANGGASFNTANPARGRLELLRPGHPSPCDLIRGKADACGWEGGRR